MFVRWKRHQHWKDKDRVSMSAVLVKSERVNGKPRQKHIAYLGTVRTHKLSSSTHVIEFWESVESKLESLELTPEEVTKIRESLLKVVPETYPEALARFKHETESFSEFYGEEEGWTYHDAKLWLLEQEIDELRKQRSEIKKRQDKT